MKQARTEDWEAHMQGAARLLEGRKGKGVDVRTWMKEWKERRLQSVFWIPVCWCGKVCR